MAAPINPFLTVAFPLFALWVLSWWQESCQQAPFGFGWVTEYDKCAAHPNGRLIIGVMPKQTLP
jgi:hypothetical protein